jgi:hypothetical protein
MNANEMDMKVNNVSNCLACGDVLRGRSDKKFCNDYCRSSYNNKLKDGSYKTIRNINNVLAKNRRILASLLPENERSRKVSPEKLAQLGFQFNYQTQVYPAGNGKTYFFCYDYGYLKLESGSYLVVRKP